MLRSESNQQFLLGREDEDPWEAVDVDLDDDDAEDQGDCQKIHSYILSVNKIRNLFKVKLYAIRSETKKKTRERERERERERKKR